MNFLSESLTARINEQVKDQLPQILPKEVSNFAPPVIEALIKESRDEVTLAKVSSQPHSTYESATTLTEFKLKNILLDKMEKSESYMAALEHQDCYDSLKKSYDLDKDFFFSYDVFSLKHGQKDKDKDEDPSAGSDQGLKKRKISKDAEPTIDSNMPLDQEGNQGDNDDEPKKETASKRDWFKKPTPPQEPTPLSSSRTRSPNENWSAVLLRKLPEKLGDPGKFLIPCDFSELEECMALADLGASINLMPFSVWKNLMLPELVPTCMTLELANRSVAYPAGIPEDVFVQVGKFTFPADYIVVDYDVDPRVPLILRRPFLRTTCALVDVYGEELTLRVGDEKLIFNIESISKYPRKHGDESINKIDTIDTTCEDYFHEVLNVHKLIYPLSGSPTPSSEPMVASLSPSLTPFRDSDFLLEETDAFLSLNDSIPPGIGYGIYDLGGDILFLEELLNDDPTNDLPPHKELKNDEIKMTKSSIEDPPELELKDLPPHLEYAFLEVTTKSPAIIAKDFKREEKDQLVKVLKSHKQAIAWKISDIKGIDPNFCTHKILMEDDFKPAVQHQRRVNPKINDVIKAEVIKLLDAGLIYPISDSPWVSPVHAVAKKVMLERLAGNEFYCFPDGFFGYFQIPIDPQDKEKTTFTALMGHLLTIGCLSVLGIFLGHKISKSGIEVDRAKVDAIAKLPPPTMVKGVRSFLGHAGFYQRFIQDFSKIARSKTHLLEKETPFVISKECMESFKILKTKLTEALILVAPD
ncbi:reverse transcriptase domain-containing protein [Tanacetum coccineum]